MALSWQDVLFAALASYAIWFFADKLLTLRKLRRGSIKTWGQVNMEEIMEHCHEIFPIESVSFGGTEFRSGMQVRITTIQKTTIEGEFIGMNKINIICVLTKNQIIAHRLEKIVEMERV